MPSGIPILDNKTILVFVGTGCDENEVYEAAYAEESRCENIQYPVAHPSDIKMVNPYGAEKNTEQ